MSSSSLHQAILNGIALALLAVFQPACAEDEFNLRILELDTPLENTSTLKNFISNNGLMPGNYPVTVMWGKRSLISARSLLCFLTIASSFFPS